MALQLGETLLPEGEAITGHDGAEHCPEEESPEMLAKRVYDTSTPKAVDPIVGLISSDGVDVEGEYQTASVEVEAKSDIGIKINRATTRFLFDPRDILNEKQKLAHRNKSCEKTCPACLLFQGLRKARHGVAQVANTTIRALWKIDGEALDAFSAEHNRYPKGTEWKIPRINSYATGRLIAPELSSGIVSAVTRFAENKWAQERYDALVKQTCSPPHFKDTLPIPIRMADSYLRKENGVEIEATTALTYWLGFSLKPGRHSGGKEFRVPLVPRDAVQKLALEKLSSGEWKRGELKIEEDRRHPGKWFARLSYSRIVPKKKEGVTAAINRGIITFVAAVTSSGSQWIYDANDIEAYLKQVQRRRRQYQNDSKASNRWGHGRKRTLQPIAPLEKKAENWRKTKCQTIARQLAMWMSQKDVSRVFIEDFSGIRNGPIEKLDGGKMVWDRIQEWPYFELQTRLTSCLQEYGIEVETVPASYISQTCPDCGCVSTANVDLKNRLFRCTACKYKSHLDIAAAKNVMARGIGVE